MTWYELRHFLGAAKVLTIADLEEYVKEMTDGAYTMLPPIGMKELVSSIKSKDAR